MPEPVDHDTPFLAEALRFRYRRHWGTVPEQERWTWLYHVYLIVGCVLASVAILLIDHIAGWGVF
ncbi:hypothetical protein [Sphingomonas pokkalii]|uniref:Uncharacterized protein n=1 Tax=Sphingomonas pokkalii TaxID=2175090 RepID=A0A2U0SBU6_9SPHN|nr:hypothetical protein [Sphingomonas pokkalii]PVX28852.1 hypothetical protein DD559_05505 [Sphingomonas pokkalii]